VPSDACFTKMSISIHIDLAASIMPGSRLPKLWEMREEHCNRKCRGFGDYTG
jgi:hypothetical protein